MPSEAAANVQQKQQLPNNSASVMTVSTQEQESHKVLILFREESAKCENWKSKYIANSLYILGSGAFGSVFQGTTRIYSCKQKQTKFRQTYHPSFLSTIASQRKLRPDMQDKLRDPNRDASLLDIVAIKYEILDQSLLEDGATRFYLFLRREFLVLDTLWRKSYRMMHGFPVVFDFDYVGEKAQFGINSKYRNIFTYLNMGGEEVKFFTDVYNRNLENVTKISYMSMELVGPSIDDIRHFFEPWYDEVGIKSFFKVSTVFKLADQVLCRLLVMHKSGFVHHDLKPDNIALGNGRAMNTVYLLDFGFAKQVSNFHPEEWMGSRKFIAIDTYNKAKANFAQDIESWFYLVLSLLYDDLPWTDEHLAKRFNESTDESARWNLVCQMKKSWWGELSEASSLVEMFKSISGLHSKELPDIKHILEQLHKRTRDLRAAMRSIDDATTLNFELSNLHSAISRGYMSIRKVLLQIFRLPKIVENSNLYDAEYRSLLDSRAEKNLPQFEWDSNNFYWEWDEDHRRLWHSVHKTEGTKVHDFKMLSMMNQHSSATVSVDKLRSLLLLGKSRSKRSEEVSYIFDRKTGLLRPKSAGQAGANLTAVPFFATNEAQSSASSDDIDDEEVF